MGLLLPCEGAQERPAGAPDALGRPETSGPHGDAVELLEGDSGPEEALGVGESAEAVVGSGDLGLGVALFHASGLGDLLDGEQAGPVEVEQGGEFLAQEGVDEVREGVGHEDVAEPPADHRAVLALDEGIVVAPFRPRLREGSDMELGEETGSQILTVGVEGPDDEGKGGDEPLEEGDEEALGDVGDGAEVLELDHLVDDVDDVGPLFAFPVAEVDGVDAQVAGLPVGGQSAARGDVDRSGVGLVEGEPAAAPLVPQVVNVAVGDRGETPEALVAVDLVLAPEDFLGGGPGELSVGLVDLDEQSDVGGRVAAPEGPRGGLCAAVADRPGAGGAGR